MADLSNIFAGFLGGAAQGLAEGESSRIQMKHRAQAQAAVSSAAAKREANLRKLATDANNSAFIGVMDGLSDTDRARAESVLGENFETNLTNLAAAGEFDDALERLMGAIEIGSEDAASNYGTTVVGKIVDKYNLEPGEWETIDGPGRQQLFADYLSGLRSGDGAGGMTPTEIDKEIDGAINDLERATGGFLPDDLDSAKKGTVSILINRGLRNRVMYHAADRLENGRSINSETLLRLAQDDLRDHIANYSGGGNPWEAFINVSFDAPPEVDTGATLSATASKAAPADPAPAAQEVAPSVDEIEAAFASQDTSYNNLYRGAGNVDRPPAAAPVPTTRTTSARSARERAVMRGAVNSLSGKSEQGKDDVVGNIVQKRLPTLRSPNGGAEAVVTQLRQDAPREYAMLASIAQERNMTPAQLIRSIYDPYAGTGAAAGR